MGLASARVVEQAVRTAIMIAKDYLEGKQIEKDYFLPATMVLPVTDIAQPYYDRYGLN